MAVRATFKKWIIATLVIFQLQLGIASPLRADDLLIAPPEIPESGADGLIDLILYVVNHPFSEGSVLLGLLVGLSKTVGWAIDATLKIPRARDSRREMLTKAKEVGDDYIRHRNAYLKFPAEIKKLEADNVAHRATLQELTTEGRYRDAEVLRRTIEKNEKTIETKKARVPVIQISEAIYQVANAEKAIAAHVNLLRTYAPRIVAQFKATNRPAYVGEWLESPEGRTFLKSKAGKAWAPIYKGLLGNMSVAIDGVTGVYNGVAAQYNAGVPASEHLRHLEPRNSVHGRMGDHFLLTDLGNGDVREVRRDQVVASTQTLCEVNLGRLAKRSKSAQRNASFRTSYRQQIWSYGSLAAVGVGLWRYAQNFESRYKATLPEARAKSRLNDKINEKAKTDLAGQIAEEKKGPNRLEGFTDVASSILASREDKIVAILQSRMGLTETANGKAELLRKRVEESKADPAEERARIAKSVENATWQVFNRQGTTSLDAVILMLYSQSDPTGDTILRRYISLIHRESLANLYGGIVDEVTLDELDNTLVPGMVAETLENLSKYVKSKKQIDQNLSVPASAIPIPGVENPAKATSQAAPANAADPQGASSPVQVSAPPPPAAAPPQLGAMPAVSGHDINKDLSFSDLSSAFHGRLLMEIAP